jgi:DNA-binding MurR/RpiR family transcriptional regulator
MGSSLKVIHNSGTERTVESRVLGLLPVFSPAERRLAEEVLAHPATVARSTITELADRCRTSRTSVTRFCRAIDLPGYAELRLALAAEAGRAESRTWSEEVGGEITEDSDLDSVLTILAKAETKAIEETAAQLDRAAAGAAIQALAAARRVDVYAVSGSGSVAGDFRLRLHRIGRPASLWTDVHDALTSATLLDERDVVLGVSHSGETKEVVEAVEVARANGARTIAVTNFPRSSLAQAADHLLLTTAQETKFRSGGMSGRHAQMLVLDCLYIGVAQFAHVESERALERTAQTVRGHLRAP